MVRRPHRGVASGRAAWISSPSSNPSCRSAHRARGLHEKSGKGSREAAGPMFNQRDRGLPEGRRGAHGLRRGVHSRSPISPSDSVGRRAAGAELSCDE